MENKISKILYIVLDGLGDLPSSDLDDMTPLQAAQTPNMDELAQRGKTGLMYTVGRGIAPESDVAVISILGYQAGKYYTGRGPLECYAAGLEVEDGSLAYRVNFATMGENNLLIDRRVGRNLTSEEAGTLAKSINEKVELFSHSASFTFKNTIGHRGVLVIKANGGSLSARVTNTDPAYGKEGVFGVAKEEFDNHLAVCQPEAGFENSQEAKLAAVLTNEFIANSHQVLEDDEINKRRVKEGKLPANVILTRDGGDSLPKFPSLGEMFNVSFGCFVEMPVERGIALLTGMKIVELPLPTGDFSHDYKLRAEKALSEIANFDGLYIHIKGPDEPAHDGKAHMKKENIEAIDKHFFGNLVPSLNLEETIVAVTADHATPCIMKAHSADPVPLLISGGTNIHSDGSRSFDESGCAKGSLGTIDGYQLMPILIDLRKGQDSD